MSEALPPGVGPEDRVVLFDGVCRLCNGWSRFLIRFDRERVFKLCSVQSDEGRAILAWFGLPTEQFQTMLLVQGDRVSIKGDAFLGVVRHLPYPWRLLLVAKLVPRRLRDALYDWVARHRYRIFGRYDTCILPTPDHEGRFL